MKTKEKKRTWKKEKNKKSTKDEKEDKLIKRKKKGNPLYTLRLQKDIEIKIKIQWERPADHRSHKNIEIENEKPVRTTGRLIVFSST